MFKKTAAAVLALILIGGAVQADISGGNVFRTSVTAHAEGTAVLDAEGTLTLSGNVVKADVKAFAY